MFYNQKSLILGFNNLNNVINQTVKQTLNKNINNKNQKT